MQMFDDSKAKIDVRPAKPIDKESEGEIGKKALKFAVISS
jgi:hypothetical protein